jgi:predicted nucleotidyltransferase component of viral defense system
VTSKAQITKIASRDGVDARVVERDYVLAHVVALVASHDGDHRCVFKGGTSLRLLHFDEYRYSADLDYSVIKGSKADALELIRHALAQPRPATLAELALETASNRVSYVGPLGAPRTIKLDLADDELVVNTERRVLRKRWLDVPDVPVTAYTKLEITAEKLRCLLQRLQCRDFVDLDLLLGDEDPIAVTKLFRKKAIHRKLDPGTFAEKFEKRVQDYRARWDRELQEYLGDVPHFDEVERRVRRALRRAKLLYCSPGPP